MSIAELALYASCWLATVIAIIYDAAAGEGWPSVAGLFAGLILGAIVFG